MNLFRWTQWRAPDGFEVVEDGELLAVGRTRQEARCQYLDGARVPTYETGPWLVPVGTPKRRERPLSWDRDKRWDEYEPDKSGEGLLNSFANLRGPDGFKSQADFGSFASTFGLLGRKLHMVRVIVNGKRTIRYLEPICEFKWQVYRITTLRKLLASHRKQDKRRQDLRKRQLGEGVVDAEWRTFQKEEKQRDLFRSFFELESGDESDPSPRKRAGYRCAFSSARAEEDGLSFESPRWLDVRAKPDHDSVRSELSQEGVNLNEVDWSTLSGPIPISNLEEVCLRAVIEEINRELASGVTCKVSGNGSGPRFVGADLRAALFILLMQETTEQTTMSRQCPACNAWFTVSNAKKKYCDDGCRVTHFRRKKALGL